MVATDLLNDHVIPFFEEHTLRLLRILTNRGTEHCGSCESHEYEHYQLIADADHSRTKAMRPQTNDIYERFHKTV